MKKNHEGVRGAQNTGKRNATTHHTNEVEDEKTTNSSH